MINIQLSDQQLQITPRQLVDPTLLVKNLDVAQAADKVAQLFSLCGKAQRSAFELACQAAQSPQVQFEKPSLPVDLIKENIEVWCWRLLLNLPRFCQSTPEIGQLTMLRKWLARNDFSRLENWFLETFAIDCKTLLEKPEKLLASRYWKKLNIFLQDFPDVSSIVSQNQLMPTAFAINHARSLACQMDQADFARFPKARYFSSENNFLISSCLSQFDIQQKISQPLNLAQRMISSSILAIAQSIHWLNQPQQNIPVLAGLQALEQVDSSEQNAEPNTENSSENNYSSGLGWVWAGRGLLVHKVKMDQGKLIDLKILAPTEWNFHPQGFLHELFTLAQKSRKPAKNWLELGCQILDPCVEYQISGFTDQETEYA